ncbi:MAG: tetratricopeptide repeat protein [Deltaproteobacteria bacterium]|nr:tetratricopeptide repeat protein [Deltaproteobacteria bacterium]
MTKSFENLTKQGLEAIENGNTLKALNRFEKAAEIAPSPLVKGYLGYCVAKERGRVKEGTSLCLEAIKEDPDNPDTYLNLGRIYALAKQKHLAVQTFQNGLELGSDERIIAELKTLGVRKGPVFKALPRENPINKYLGFLFNRLGLR